MPTKKKRTPDHVITDNSISVVIKRKPYTMNGSHPSFTEVRNRIAKQKFDGIEKLFAAPQDAPDIKELLAEIKHLKDENRRLGEAFALIQTRQSRKLLYDWLTLADAKQIGVNIEAIIAYAFGDMTKKELGKTIKHVGHGD